MKRSDMIKFIAIKLKLSGNHYCDDNRDLDDAESIVNIIEQLGMLPPPKSKEVFELNDSGLYYKIGYKFRPNEETGDHESNWDSEDV